MRRWTIPSSGWADGKPGVFLVIFKQPGANVIDTVDSVMKQLPHLQAGIPPAIKVSVLSDRTQTIRAAVKDVQFTLLLTIGLVVMVIFVFLRSVWATIIPVDHGAAGAAGRLRADVDRRLQPRQSVADGAHHRGRLRGRRCHRDAGEHHPLYRGGRDADGRRAQGRERNRLHDHLDLAFR